MQIEEIPVEKIFVSEYNSRGEIEVDEDIKELAENIKQNDLQQPPVVWKTDDRYELIAGQRRFLACSKVLNWEKIPVRVISAKTKADAIIISLSENIMRKNLPLSQARAIVEILYNEIRDPKKIARKLGKSEQWVKDMIALRLAPQEAVNIAEAKGISKEYIKKLVGIYYGKPDQDEKIISAVMAIADKSGMERDAQIEGYASNPDEKPERVEPKTPERVKMTLHIYSKQYERLKEASKDLGVDTAEDAAGVAIAEWLTQRYGT